MKKLNEYFGKNIEVFVFWIVTVACSILMIVSAIVRQYPVYIELLKLLPLFLCLIFQALSMTTKHERLFVNLTFSIGFVVFFWEVFINMMLYPLLIFREYVIHLTITSAIILILILIKNIRFSLSSRHKRTESNL